MYGMYIKLQIIDSYTDKIHSVYLHNIPFSINTKSHIMLIVVQHLKASLYYKERDRCYSARVLSYYV